MADDLVTRLESYKHAVVHDPYGNALAREVVPLCLEAAARIRELEAAMEWRPIDDEAKSGKPVLLLFPETDEVRIARCNYCRVDPPLWLECGAMPGRSWGARVPLAYRPDPEPPK